MNTNLINGEKIKGKTTKNNTGQEDARFKLKNCGYDHVLNNT